MKRTKLQSLTKAMDLSLIPTEATKKYIVNNHIIENDRKLNDAAVLLREAVDEFLRLKIVEGLEAGQVDFKELAEQYYKAKVEAQTSRTSFDERRAYDALKNAAISKLQKSIEKLKFNLTSDKFLKEELLVFLEKESKLPNKSTHIAIINSADGLAPLMANFMTNRRTSLVKAAERCITNFEIYIENIDAINAFKDNEEYTMLLSEYEEAYSFNEPAYYYLCRSFWKTVSTQMDYSKPVKKYN